jgi:ketosteroid isomerase-like protein
MAEDHPNIALIRQLNPADMASAANLFAPDVVFHYFNPRLPELQGDYHGLDGIGAFFRKIGAETRGTFRVEPVALTPVGDELVVVQTRNSMTREGEPISVDVVVVWRIVDGRIAEVWDIPSVHTLAAQPPG